VDPLYDADRVLLASSHAIERARAQGRNEIEPDDLLIGFLYAASRFGIARIGPLAVDLLALGLRFDVAEPQRGVKPRYSARAAGYFDRAARVARSDGQARILPIHFLAVLGEPGVPTFDALAASHHLEHAGWRSALAACPPPAEAAASSPTPDRGAVAEGLAPAAGWAGATDDELLSPEEAAHRLGVHTQTVRGYIRDGRLPAFRIAGERAIRIRRDDVLALLQAMPVARGEGPAAATRN
jgi:excisionase family DNA binding protein